MVDLMVFDGVLNKIFGISSDEVPRIDRVTGRGVSQVMTDHFFPERDLWDERWRDEELRRQVIGVIKHGWEIPGTKPWEDMETCGKITEVNGRFSHLWLPEGKDLDRRWLVIFRISHP